MSTPEANSARRNRPGRSALLIWGAVLVLSGSGIGAGGALLFRKPPAPPPLVDVKNEPDPGPPDFRAGPIVSHMSRELKLTPEQTEQVTAAYSQSLAAIKTLRADMVVKLTAEHEKLRAAMKKTLTDAQFTQWDQRFEAMRSRMMPDAPPWHDFHHHGGPGGEMEGPDGHGRGPGPGGPGMMHWRGPGGSDDSEAHPGDGPDAHQVPPGPPGGQFRNDGGTAGPRGDQGDHWPRKGEPPTEPAGPEGQVPVPQK